MKEILKDFHLNPDDTFLRKLREVKSPEEMEWIGQAQRIGEETFRHICSLIKPGVCEADIAIEIDYHMRKLGGQMPAFDTIVVSGQNSSKPHGVPTAKKVENGDFVTMDFGTKIHGYCGDMTRTVAVGFVTDEMKRVYEVVRQAQSEALGRLCAGLTGKEADALARNVIEKAGFGPCFGHSLGHGVGLDIHEEPRFSALFETIIEENTVVSVEPGIYIPGKFGVRIEDLVVILKNGIRNFNSLGNDLIIL
jgi:Xaa-Pro aminopeptidase